MGARAAFGGGKKSVAGRLLDDARLARELGVSVKRLYGWEPRRTVTPIEGGGFVVELEPEFDDEQREILLASMLIDRDTGQYGESRTEAFSPDADPNGGKYRYVTGAPFVNFAEKAVLDAQDAYKKQYKDANLNGLHWAVRKVPTRGEG